MPPACPADRSVLCWTEKRVLPPRFRGDWRESAPSPGRLLARVLPTFRVPSGDRTDQPSRWTQTPLRSTRWLRSIAFHRWSSLPGRDGPPPSVVPQRPGMPTACPWEPHARCYVPGQPPVSQDAHGLPVGVSRSLLGPRPTPAQNVTIPRASRGHSPAHATPRTCSDQRKHPTDKPWAFPSGPAGSLCSRVRAQRGVLPPRQQSSRAAKKGGDPEKGAFYFFETSTPEDTDRCFLRPESLIPKRGGWRGLVIHAADGEAAMVCGHRAGR